MFSSVRGEVSGAKGGKVGVGGSWPLGMGLQILGTSVSGASCAASAPCR